MKTITRKFNCSRLESRVDGKPGSPIGVYVTLEIELNPSDGSFGPDHPYNETYRIDGTRVRADVFHAVLLMLAPAYPPGSSI